MTRRDALYVLALISPVLLPWALVALGELLGLLGWLLT